MGQRSQQIASDLGAVHARHANVQAHDLRAGESRLFKNLKAIANLPNDLQVGLRIQEMAQGFPEQLVVVS